MGWIQIDILVLYSSMSRTLSESWFLKQGLDWNLAVKGAISYNPCAPELASSPKQELD